MGTAISVKTHRLESLATILYYFESMGYERKNDGLGISLRNRNPKNFKEIYFYINNSSAVPGRENLVYVEVVESCPNFKVAELRRINLLDDYEKNIRNIERRISLAHTWATG